MRLYVTDKSDGKKIHLKQTADNRNELIHVFNSQKIKVGEHVYYIGEIFAEPSDNTAAAMAIGGVIGIVGGVPGVMLGGAIGALLGKNSDDEDMKKVELFNRSSINVF